MFNNLAMILELDLLNEKMDQATIRITQYKDHATNKVI